MRCRTLPQTMARIVISLILLAAYTLAESTSTTIVAITATTTVTQTATGTEGACDNFYGACVIYGSYGSTAEYTTTVYGTPLPPASPEPPPNTTPSPTTTLVTSTSTIEQTTTVSETGACQNYDGSCVVYGADGSPTTTVYSGSSSNEGQHGHPGNSDGEIGESSGSSDGAIGAAAGYDIRFTSTLTVGILFVILSIIPMY